MLPPYLHICFIRKSIPDDRKIPLDGLLPVVTISDLPSGIVPEISFVIFAGFIPGYHRGETRIEVKALSPSGEIIKNKIPPLIIFFEPPVNQQTNIIINVDNFKVQEEGLYWFLIKADGQLKTRIPLEVLIR